MDGPGDRSPRNPSPSSSGTSLAAAAYEEPDSECPICGGKVRPRDLLQAHVDYCLTQMERKESQQQQQQQQKLNAPSPRSTGSSSSSGGSTTPRGQAITPPQSAAASSSAKPTTPPAARADSQQTKASAGGSSSGGGLRGLFSRSRRVASVSVDIKNEYKQLRKAIMETSLALCTKREAVQLAAIAMRLDIAHEECRTKKPKEELDLYKREKQKPSLGQYYSPHWLNVSEPSELAAELLSELEQLEESLAGKTAQEVQTGLMTDYVAQCQALPFYGMTVFSVLEWRVKDGGSGSKGKGKESAPRGSAAEDSSSPTAAGDDGDNAQNDKKADKKEKKTKTKKEKKQAKVKYEKVPVSLGITRDCSLIKIDERNEVEMAWRITQIKSYSLMLREGREKQRATHMPSPYDFILTLDFGHFFPHYLQLLNRQPKGLLGKTPRQRLRENAMIRLADESEDAIRLIYVQLHSYIQQASGRAREERRQMEERLALYGLRERDVVGDGNCQMRAISYQLFQTEDKHIEIRKAIVKWLQNNANYAVRETSTGRVISRLIDFLETDYHRTWSDYCSYMSKDKSWGDHMTLLAAAEIYSVNIWILSSVDVTNEQGEASEPWSTIEPHLSTAQRMIRLAHWHEKHFSALAPAS